MSDDRTIPVPRDLAERLKAYVWAWNAEVGKHDASAKADHDAVAALLVQPVTEEPAEQPRRTHLAPCAVCDEPVEGAHIESGVGGEDIWRLSPCGHASAKLRTETSAKLEREATR